MLYLIYDHLTGQDSLLWMKELTANCIVVSEREFALDAALTFCAPATCGEPVVSLVLLALFYIRNNLF